MSARIEQRDDRLIIYNGNQNKRGALSLQLYEAIKETSARAADDAIRAVILTADGPFFCSGGDLTQLQENRNLSERERRVRIEALHEVVRAIRDCPVPFIAAVEGGAAGAGASLALAADFIVAADNADFTAAYVKAGLTPDGGLTHSLASLLPRALVMEMCVLGRPVAASRLMALGAINTVVPSGQVLAAANELADAICVGPPQAQRAIRSLVNSAYASDFGTQLDAECEAMATASGAAEAREGIDAFLEKRAPHY